MTNVVHLIGRVGKDPDVRTTQSSRVASFSLATSEKYKDKETTQWHNIVIWGKLAEIAEKYIKKGMLLYVEGKINYRDYEDKDGNKKYVTDIVCQNFSMLSAGKQPDEKQSEPEIQTGVHGDLPF